MDRKTTILAAIVAFGLAALGSRLLFSPGTPPPAPDPKPTVAASGTTYAALLADLDRRIDGLQARTEGRARDWLTRMHLGTALFERAGLTNQLADYARVQAVLDEAFAAAPDPAGPVVLAARFNFSIHRLSVAEQFLAKLDRQAIPQRDDQTAARLLRAEIAIQRGQYDGVEAELTMIAKALPAFGDPSLALYHAKTGKPDEATRLLGEALTLTSPKDPQRRAWLSLQLGVVAMNRGELQAALQHFKNADAELADWWLVQEQIAEVHSRRDQHARAIEIFEQLVPTTDLPQHMDQLAALYRHAGKPEQADEWIARAAARWDQALAQFPESAMGHALQHYLQFGPPARALELALANHANRPGGDAKVSLAQAYLQLGRAAEALPILEQVLQTPYRTAKLHDVAAKVHTALGDTAAAEAQMALCYALNPMYTSDDHTH